MKIQLKRSNQLDGSSAKQPTPAQMSFGELAVNYSNSDPAIFLKKEGGEIIRIAGAGGTGSGTADITLDAGDGLSGGGTFSLDDTTNVTIDFDVDIAPDRGLAFHNATNQLGLVNGTASGQAMIWNGSAWAPAAQTDTTVTYTLSDESVTDGAQINLDGSDGSQDSFQILGDGDITVSRTDGVVTVGANFPSPATVNDGKLTIEDAGGTELGAFTANQANATTITLPAINDGTLTISDSAGNSLGEFTANQSGNTSVTLPAINDGILIINDFEGTEVGRFTANQSGNTTIALPEGGGGASVTVSSNPPTDPAPDQGDLWWSNEDGRLYIYYEEPDGATGQSDQWVPATPESGGSPEVNADGGIEINGDNELEIKIKPNSGLETDADGLGVKLKTNGGLQNTADGLCAYAGAGYGIQVGEYGIVIGDDWSNIPSLPGV